MSMSKNQANAILSRMSIMLQKEFGDGFDIKFGKTTFSADGKINFKFSMIDKSAATFIKENDDLIGMRKNGVHADAIGHEVLHNNQLYIVESISPRKMKYCVNVRRADGKKFRFTAKFINDVIYKDTGVRFIAWHK